MVIKRLSMVMFIFGTLIAILGGSFVFIPETQKITILTLIILGTFIGIINISREEENGFLIAGGVFIIASLAIQSILASYLLLDVIGKILNNLIILFAPACIVVALRVVFDFASQSDWSIKREERAAVEIYHRLSDKQKLWDSAVLFAVAITFIIIVLQLFFETGEYDNMIAIANSIVLAIFVIDLMVLYRRVHDLKKFVKTSWLDIIAVIPLGTVFRITKLVRFIRILEHMSKASKASLEAAKVSRINAVTKATRIGDLNRPAKVFSDSSERFEKGKKKKKK